MSRAIQDLAEFSYVTFGSRYGWTNIECRAVETCDSTDGSNIMNWLIKRWPVSIIKCLCNNETDLLCDAERDAALKQKPEHPITSIHQRLINGIIKDLFLGRSDRGQNGRLDQVCWKGRQGALCHRITYTTEANQIDRTRVQLGDSDIFDI